MKYCTGARNLGSKTQGCCQQHDLAYSKTSTMPRMHAATDLLLCVAMQDMPWRAIAMFIVVRAFGWIRYKA